MSLYSLVTDHCVCNIENVARSDLELGYIVAHVQKRQRRSQQLACINAIKIIAIATKPSYPSSPCFINCPYYWNINLRPMSAEV